ncbi:MAG: DcaP family trimeric outer membrane transporter [Sulfurimonas sp.]|nr:DcaP family trimeric outer membrane transporter [Sulfurimonas sp.]
MGKRKNLALSMLLGCGALFANDEVEVLRKQVQELSQKIDSIEKQQKVQKGVLELVSTDTVLSIGGRIQLNGAYSSPDASYFASKIPANSEQKSDKFSMNARDSRLWVKTRTPSEYGMIRTTLEIDFFGSAATNVSVNDHNPRLRHAYVQVGDFGFGQTNSAFNSVVAIETANYAMDDTFVRQPVVRYTHNSGDWAWDVSFEEPNAMFFKDGSSSLVKGGSDTLPDLVLRGRYFDTWGEVGLAYLSRYIRYKEDDNTLPTFGTSDAKYGYGLNLSGRIKTFGLDGIRFNAHYGEGSGRYIAYNGFGAGTITSQGAIELTEIYGGHIGYRHWWSTKLRSTLAFSYIGANTSDEALGYGGDPKKTNITKESYATQLNLFYNPLKNLLAGVELSDATRKFKDGRRGDAQAVNLIVRFDF